MDIKKQCYPMLKGCAGMYIHKLDAGMGTCKLPDVPVQGQFRLLIIKLC